MKKENLTTFIASRIRTLRKEKRYSQEKLAVDSGLDPRYVNKFENGRYNARLETIDKLLETLETSYSEFFQFDLQINQRELNQLLQILSEMPEEEQQEKLKAILTLLKS
ncbi:helix-turn-helix domain-containing protein [Streptococcus merionis]|uniref:helix-turn-helix domain-containing protein n=1 Tax=Streptococcus merionis TaxID=400065 RepID=UPI0035187DF9